MEKKKCSFCENGYLERKVLEETYEYKGHKITLNQPGEYCNSCEEAIFSGNDLKINKKTLHDWQTVADGFLPSDEVRRIRKKLGLTQRQAAEIFGGGPNAFSRYECGDFVQMKSTDNLLRLLDKYPHLLEEILHDEAA